MPMLPIDIWLLVFAELDDHLFLWSTCRNLSRFLRDCVDEFLSHGLVQTTLLDLYYCDFHTSNGPEYHYVHVPLVFHRFENNGLRAVFQQQAYRRLPWCRLRGSVRGWVPFVERYCEETGYPKPKVRNRTKTDVQPPLWEREHEWYRNNLLVGEKQDYLLNVGDMTGIARGDRPPFYIRILDIVDDTNLVGLAIDCDAREVSFNWRKTFNLFFRQRRWIGPVDDFSAEKRTYDKPLDAVATRYMDRQLCFTRSGRARQKRLRDWTAKNKHRMTPEVRLWAARRVDNEKNRLQRYLTPDNLIPLPDDSDDSQEIVPGKLAQDHPDLLFWPWVDTDGYFVPVRAHSQLSIKCCTIL